MPRSDARFGTKDKFDEAMEVLTLARAMLDGQGAGSGGGNAVTLDATTTEIFDVGPVTQILSADSTIVAGDVVNAEASGGDIILKYLTIGPAGYYFRSDGTNPVWTLPEVGDFSDLDYASPNLTLGQTNVEGSADTVMRTDATIALFDDDVVLGQVTLSASDGTEAFAARTDHGHILSEAIDATWTGDHIFNNDISIASAKGLIYDDSVAAGKILRADGTRFIPDD